MFRLQRIDAHIIAIDPVLLGFFGQCGALMWMAPEGTEPMDSQIDFRIKRLFACRALFASLFLLSASQPLLAQTPSGQVATQTEQAPMDEDWHNDVSTDALLRELTRLATELEQQRKDNQKLAAQVARLTHRIDGMQEQLAVAGNGVPAANQAPAVVDLSGPDGGVQPSLLATKETPSLAASIASGQKAEGDKGVEMAPLAPLTSAQGAGIKAAKHHKEDDSYFSYTMKKSKELFAKLTDW